MPAKSATFFFIFAVFRRKKGKMTVKVYRRGQNAWTIADIKSCPFITRAPRKVSSFIFVGIKSETFCKGISRNKISAKLFQIKARQRIYTIRLDSQHERCYIKCDTFKGVYYMPVAENRKRVYVTLSDDMVDKIDLYRNQMGLTRSAFCAYVIGQNVMAMDKAMSVLDDSAKRLIKTAEKSIPR